MNRSQKKLLILVTSLSLLLHAAGIYMLCELSVVGGMLGLSKNPFPFHLKSVVLQEAKEIASPLEIELPLERDVAIQEEVAPPLLNNLLKWSFDEKASHKGYDASLTMPEEKNSYPTLDQMTDIMQSNADLVICPPDTVGHSSLDSEDSKPSRVAQSDHFIYQMEYAPRRYRGGYVFKISLYPKNDICFKRMRQNFFFLIDRSNSIPRGRYFLNKKAISAILPSLHREDHFNILVFDDRVLRMAPQLVECTPENVLRAQNFLENLSHGGYFSTTDIYASLGRVLPKLVSDTEINTAILLSDGDTYLTVENQRLLIRNWSEANDGKVTLFCFASGTGNNLNLLETIAAFNKGSFVYVSDHHQIEERMQGLIQSLRHPIGKEMAASALAINTEARLHLLPKNGRLPDLYQHRPYIIYGVTNRLDDFTLFLQGKFYDRPFDIRKKISFAQARVGTLDIERKYTALLAQDYFEQFFKDGKIAHLEAAKRLLAPLDMAAPFLY